MTWSCFEFDFFIEYIIFRLFFLSDLVLRNERKVYLTILKTEMKIKPLKNDIIRYLVIQTPDSLS